MTHPGEREIGTRLRHLATVLACISALGGCALSAPAPIPAAVQVPPAGNLQLIEAYPDPSVHTGTSVRWGGNVIQINHDGAGNALIQVIERRLDADGRPIDGSASDGRFMIRAAAAVDPQFYALDRLITVAGTIDGSIMARVGGATQSMPVVRITEFMLWSERWRDDPYWRDPYWRHDGPWYGPRINVGVGVSHYQRSHRRRRH